jgi:hypothetical protein
MTATVSPATRSPFRFSAQAFGYEGSHSIMGNMLVNRLKRGVGGFFSLVENTVLYRGGTGAGEDIRSIILQLRLKAAL